MTEDDISVADMRLGVRYIVTLESVDKEFQLGDWVSLCADGGIDNFTVRGTMPKEDLPRATRGMTVRVDSKWAERQRIRLTKQLSELDTLLEKFG